MQRQSKLYLLAVSFMFLMAVGAVAAEDEHENSGECHE
jgi:hypothetical protein